jgi:UDP-4-amino-4,6-dideoxy-N-acetyl-beta-L-altrosamine transaminase
MIPYGRQTISEEDVRAVVEVLGSDFLTQGPAVPRFEAAVLAACHARHAVAVNSATSALHIACLALGLGEGDVLWTVPNTFVASANCGLYCGASVDFVDIDPRTYNMSVTALETKLLETERSGKLPKVVIPVHFSGQSCDMRAIAGLAQRFGFRVIEDASHAIGATYENEPVGVCRYSDITIFSFHPVKIVTTAEGGVAVTNDAKLARRMELLRSHGITRVKDELQAGQDQGWYYEQVDLGFNYRMTELQAALGVSQMRRLDEFVGRRRVLARRYDESLKGQPLRLPFQDGKGESAFHLYVIQVDENAGAVDRRTLYDRLRRAGIGVNVHYIPVHLQPYYQRLGFHAGQFPVAESYYANAISIPLYFGLSQADQSEVIRQVEQGIRA